MSRTFEHDGRTYTFRKEGGLYAPVRDDGCSPYHIWASYDVTPQGVVPVVRAHPNLFGSISEAQAYLRGDNVATYTGFDRVWAKDAEEATRVKEADNGNA